MKNAICLLLICCAWTFAQPSPAQESGGFVVIVNAANAVDEIDRDRAGKFFLKQLKRWDDGVAAAPVDQGPQSEVRDAFTREVHRSKITAIKSFWQRKIFSGRAVPPPELDSDASVIAFVRGEPGGIGYVSPGAELGEGVKELKLTVE
jgi:ABC-type phosphate transport system substrate-binding protein